MAPPKLIAVDPEYLLSTLDYVIGDKAIPRLAPSDTDPLTLQPYLDHQIKLRAGVYRVNDPAYTPGAHGTHDDSGWIVFHWPTILRNLIDNAAAGRFWVNQTPPNTAPYYGAETLDDTEFLNLCRQIKIRMDPLFPFASVNTVPNLYSPRHDNTGVHPYTNPWYYKLLFRVKATERSSTLFTVVRAPRVAAWGGRELRRRLRYHHSLVHPSLSELPRTSLPPLLTCLFDTLAWGQQTPSQSGYETYGIAYTKEGMVFNPVVALTNRLGIPYDTDDENLLAQVSAMLNTTYWGDSLPLGKQHRNTKDLCLYDVCRPLNEYDQASRTMYTFETILPAFETMEKHSLSYCVIFPYSNPNCNTNLFNYLTYVGQEFDKNKPRKVIRKLVKTGNKRGPRRDRQSVTVCPKVTHFADPEHLEVLDEDVAYSHEDMQFPVTFYPYKNTWYVFLPPQIYETIPELGEHHAFSRAAAHNKPLSVHTKKGVRDYQLPKPALPNGESATLKKFGVTYLNYRLLAPHGEFWSLADNILKSTPERNHYLDYYTATKNFFNWLFTGKLVNEDSQYLYSALAAWAPGPKTPTARLSFLKTAYDFQNNGFSPKNTTAYEQFVIDYVVKHDFPFLKYKLRGQHIAPYLKYRWLPARSVSRLKKLDIEIDYYDKNAHQELMDLKKKNRLLAENYPYEQKAFTPINANTESLMEELSEYSDHNSHCFNPQCDVCKRNPWSYKFARCLPSTFFRVG